MGAKLDQLWMGCLHRLQKWTRRKLARAYCRHMKRILRRQLQRDGLWLN